MKKLLFLFLLTFTTISYSQTTLANKLKITANITDNTASKVNVQDATGLINTIPKLDLIDVLEYASVINLPITGVSSKIYVTIDNKKLYRWNGTIYQELASTNILGKENIENKQNDLTPDGTGTKYPTVDAVFDALATKAPISSVHNPVTLGTENGLSLSTQQLSLGLASSGVTGALSGTDWNTFNNKVNGTGTNNFLTKWSGTNTVNASGAWRETSNRLANAADNGSSEFQVTGQIDLKSKNTQGDGGQLGAELLTSGSSDASWTGTSFATGYTHVAGSATTLTSTLSPVVSNLYQVAYTVTGRTAGSFTIAFGGTTTSGITSTGAVGHRTSTTGTLVITPTSDFNGTIVLSIKQITAGTASFVFRDNGGTIRNELRSSGNNNTANGVNALQNNTTGNNNTANGVAALRDNTTGGNNTANGVGSLRDNTTGGNNTANGVNAGRYISNGATPLIVANNGTFLGTDTKALADNSTNETVVGFNATGNGNNTVSIGNTSVVSSRLRGRLLQGNVVDNLIDSGQFSGNVLATGFKTASGTASQFLKANGSVDSNTYLTSASLPTVDQTIIDGSTNAVAGNAVFDALALKANVAGSENISNKQNDLTPDGTGTKYPTVDAVFDALALKAPLASPSLTGTPTAPTPTVGTNTTQIATTAFVNGGLATKENAFTKNTAFNKNFGTTAGTVVEGGTLGTNAYNSTAFAPLNGTGANGTWGINISGNAGTATNSSKWNNQNFEFAGIGSISGYIIGRGADGTWRPASVGETRDWLGLGSNAYTSTAYLPLSGGALTGIVTAPTAPAGTNTTQIATTAFVQATSRPYKVYTALLSQSGASAPVATVLENTLGGTVVWSRNSGGIYFGTLNGSFTSLKTGVLPINSLAIGGQVIIQRASVDVIQINTLNGGINSDNGLNGQMAEIRVYN